MTRGYGSTDTCAGCFHFPLADTLQTEGWAWCAYAEGARPFDYRPCPLHTAAKDRAQRAGLVKELIQLTTKKEP